MTVSRASSLRFERYLSTYAANYSVFGLGGRIEVVMCLFS